jgi:hypothetical protein
VFAAPANIAVEAEASDADGWVSGMEVIIGPVRLTSVGAEPGTKAGTSLYRFTWPNVPVGEYLLVARALDNQGAAAHSTAVRVSVAANPTDAVLVPGYLRRQVYLDVPGITLADLTSSPKFPDQPDLVDLNTPFETPSNVYDNYGTRLTGFVLPPVTGEYVFYIASDDQGALYLSTDENPANKVQIAFEPTWSGPRMWVESPNGLEPSKISAPIRLESGRKYYVEALMKEGGGGDNLGVAWQKPGDPPLVNGDPPIPGEYLATYWPHPIPPPAVTITAPDPTATEQSPLVDAIPDTGHFVVARTGNVQDALTVRLEIGGIAINGTDYESIKPEVVIPAGSATTDIWLNAIDDALVEGEETVILRIAPPHNPTDPTLPPVRVSYLIGEPSVARAVIRDNDLAPNQAPQAALVSPPDGAVIVAPERVRLIAHAADPDGWVTGVEFFADGVSLGVVPPPPISVVPSDGTDEHPEIDPVWPLFQLVWTNPPAGQHVLKVVATDNAGATGESAPVTITLLEPSIQQVVTVVATDPMAAEPDADPVLNSTLPDWATFRIRRVGDLSIPLPVFFTLSGSASNGIDYTELPLTVTIPANERSVDVVVRPLDDALVEGTERVVLTLEAPVCPAIWPPPPECYLVGVPARARAVIVDNDPPMNQPPVAKLVHPGSGEVFHADSDIRLAAIARDSDGSVVSVEFFADDQSLGVVGAPEPGPLGPIPDRLPFSMIWSNAPAGSYLLKAVATDNLGATGESEPVRIFVVSHRPPFIVSVEATLPETMEPNPLLDCAIADCLPEPAVFTVHRRGPTNEPLNVIYELRGAADNGVDYRELPGWVTIPAGQTSTTVLVEPLDDALVEGTEDVILRLIPDPRLPAVWPPPPLRYLVGDPGSARVRILDNDSPPAVPHVEIVQPHNGQGFLLGAPIEIIAATPVVPPLVQRVEFWADGAKIGDGVEQPPEALGARFFTFTWADAPVGQHEIVAKAFTTAGEIGPSGVSAPVWIAVYDQQVQVVTIEATDAVASEPGVLTVIDNAEFTVRRTGGASRPLTVFYRIQGTAENGTDYERLTGTVTLGEDENWATISVNALRDERVEGDETVLLTLLPAILPPGGPTDPVSEGRWFYVLGTPASARAVIRDANAPANLPPSVRIAEPREGWVFTNPPALRLHASAQDRDGRVVGVEFFANDVKLGDGTRLIDVAPGVYGFGLVWTNPPPGAYALTARATDDDGATAFSAPVHIKVLANDQPPRVEIARPHQGETFQVPADVPIVVQATDPDGWVPLVEFFADGVKIGEQHIAFIVAPPPGETQVFSMTWSNVPPGTHVLTARATDDGGLTGTSPRVSILVIEQNQPPVVSVWATDPFAQEKPMNGQTNIATFRIQRTGKTNEALSVWYSLQGTAENGKDYVAIPGSGREWGILEIPAGRRSARLSIQPINDDLPEGIETVILKLEPSPTLGPIEPYRVGLPGRAAAVITDDDSQIRPPVHCLADGAFHVTVPGQTGLVYRLERSDNLQDWVTVADGVALDGRFHYVDPAPNGAGQRFYRVRPMVLQAMPADD